MSVEIMSDVWKRVMSSTHKLVLLSLANYANKEGVAWPSVSSLMECTNLSERGVQRSLRELEALGHLSRISVGGGRNQTAKYQINPAPETPYEKPRMRNGVSESEKKPETPHIDAKNPAPRAPDPSITVNKRTTKEPFVLPEWVDPSVFSDFEEHRKGIKAKLTDIAKRRLIAELDRLRRAGNDPNAVLNQSIINGWRGVFELKGVSGAGAKQKNNGGNYLPRSDDDWVRVGKEHNIIAKPGESMANFQARVKGALEAQR